MGYVHNREMSQFVSFLEIGSYCAVAEVWTIYTASNVFYYVRPADDQDFTLYIPVPIPSSSEAIKGSYLKSIELMYRLSNDADDFEFVRVYKDTLQPSAASGSGSINTAAEVAVTIDAGHNTEAERLAADEHRMKVTLTTAAWIGNNEAYHMEMVVETNGISDFQLFGAIINYTFRL